LSHAKISSRYPTLATCSFSDIDIPILIKEEVGGKSFLILSVASGFFRAARTFGWRAVELHSELAAVLVILWHGDRELDGLDFVLSEFHLGATYGAIIRRRLWHHRQVDVLLIPLVILALTYAVSMSGQTILLTSIAMYAAVWHRGRQSLGVVRFYQPGIGGPVSWTHDLLFRGAIYLPMAAAMFAYTYLAPSEYEGEPKLALNFGAEMTSLIGIVAAL
jgi:hypothetical protein